MPTNDDKKLEDIMEGGETIPNPPSLPSFDTYSKAAWDAAMKWLTNGGQKKKCCTLSPMDEMSYFQTPVTRKVSVSSGVPVEACTVNSMRVALCFWRATVNGNVVIGLDETIAIDPQVIGLPVNGNLPPIIFTQAKHGPLCQSQWFAIGISDPDPLFLLVTEVILSKWTK